MNVCMSEVGGERPTGHPTGKSFRFVTCRACVRACVRDLFFENRLFDWAVARGDFEKVC